MSGLRPPVGAGRRLRLWSDRWLASWHSLVCFDIREVRREVSFGRSLFNRAQVSLSGMTGSWHSTRWAATWILAGPRFSSDSRRSCGDCPVNYLLVALTGESGARGRSSDVVGDMYLGSARRFAVLMCASVSLRTGGRGLLGWGIAGVSFSHRSSCTYAPGLPSSSQLEHADRRIEVKDEALRNVEEQMLRERRDERMALAGELHDEVLPPLFKVHLMGQVLRQDLNTGRLLDLDEDLPELLSATEVAQAAIRVLVRDLRRSQLGPGGLVDTLRATSGAAGERRLAPIALDLTQVKASQLSAVAPLSGHARGPEQCGQAREGHEES